MKRNAFGISLLLVLFAALLVAYLLLDDLQIAKTSSSSTQSMENYVAQAQNLVDQINQAQQQTATLP